MKDNFIESFQSKLQPLEIHLTDKQMDQFYQYYEILIEWNQVMNLTTITDMEDVITKHFIDSLCFCYTKLPVDGKKLIDVGTGAGFPGIPLKIVYPGLTVTLMDSLNKKVRFLDHLIDQLQLDDIKTCHSRAEELGHKPEYREKYDYSVSRAVANLSTLSEYCLPFVKIGGDFIAYKSGNVENELREAKGAFFQLGAKLNRAVPFSLPEGDGDRTIIIVSKRDGTSKKYPRKPGTPGKEPIRG